jgi:ABC-type Fe3+ transport system permease subunit
MLVLRWLRSLARFVLGVVLIAPVVALPLAVLLDRGPDGEARLSPHVFPLVLWLFDDFAWTCARNSLIFAVLVSLLSLALGGALGWVVACRRFWGRGILHGLLIGLSVVTPAFLALGLAGLMGTPRPWPWPFSSVDGGTKGVSLESWRGLPLWIVWIWSTLPWGVALVMLVTSSAVERLERSWQDAARLTGVGSLRAWRVLFWPLVRPSSARAAALVFGFALVEPGAPLVLGLRRTLAFQMVDAAGRSDPFPSAAVWAFMAGFFTLAGWMIWRWAGGAPILTNQDNATSGSRTARLPRSASRVRAVTSTVLLAVWALVGWLPIVGLVYLVIGARRVVPLSSAGYFRTFFDQARQLSEPPVPRILVNSLILGVEVAAATIALAWLVGPGSLSRSRQRLGSLVARRIALVPPLVQGVGFLAFPWLAGLASSSIVDLGGWRPLAGALGRISTELGPFRNPWSMMSFCVALALVPRFLIAWQREARRDLSRVRSDSAFDAALLAGASRAGAVRLSRPLPRARWFAGCFLACSLAATNLTPALLFEPWIDGQTVAPAVLLLAVGPTDARSQAAMLALCAIAVNLLALAIARVSAVLPRGLDLD